MKNAILAVFLLVSASALAQRPQPFVALGANLYDVVGASAIGGVYLDTPHFTTVDEAGYETGGKTKDNANTTGSGHDRYLRGDALVKFGSWGFGPGAGWTKTYTPAYYKTHVHPRFSLLTPKTAYYSRLMITYVHPGTDWQNDVQGFEAQAWIGEGHLFFRGLAGGYWAHTTVTDRSNLPLTAAQKSQRIVASQAQFILGWRF